MHMTKVYIGDLDQFFLQTGDPVCASYLFDDAFESAMVLIMIIFENLHIIERMRTRCWISNKNKFRRPGIRPI